MSAISASLVDDAGNTLLTMDRSTAGLVLNEIDLGYPTPREAATVLSGQDGDNDVTLYSGSRAITAVVTLPPSGVGSLMDTVNGLMHPGRRYWLYVWRDDWAAFRMIRVRGASKAMRSGRLPLTAQLGWKSVGPGAALQDVTATSVKLFPAAQPGGGMSLPAAFPVAFQPGLVPGASILTVNGTAPAPPVIDMYGPCTGPLFRVVATGLQVSMPSLSIAQGDFVRVDVAARTVLLNNNASQSLLNAVDYSSSSWPLLPQGSPQVVFSPASSGAGCQAVVTWRSQWL